MGTRLRAKKTIQKLVENGGRSVSRAMRESGFGAGYAKNPKKFMETDTAKRLLEEYFPDNKLHEKTQELRTAARPTTMTFNAAKVGKRIEHVDDKEIRATIKALGFKVAYIRVQQFPPAKIAYYLAPERKIQLDANEMAYKLKGSFAPEKHVIENKNPLQELSDEELAAVIKENKDFLTKK